MFTSQHFLCGESQFRLTLWTAVWPYLTRFINFNEQHLVPHLVFLIYVISFEQDHRVQYRISEPYQRYVNVAT